MCIAIWKRPNKEISKRVLQICSNNNPDGCGFAYNKNGEVIIEKFLNFKSFYKRYRKAVEENKEAEFLIHFRVKTHGKINLDNCHPFRVNPKEAFIHNGTISKVGATAGGEESDTQLFNKKVLQDLPTGWENSKMVTKWVEDYIGASRIAVIKGNGNVTLLNGELGHWNDGIWWSNYTYKCMDTFDKYTGKEKPQPVKQENTKSTLDNFRSTVWPNRARNNKVSGVTDLFDRLKMRDSIVAAIKSGNFMHVPTMQKHNHARLSELEGDVWLQELATQDRDYTECSVCGHQEFSYLITRIYLSGTTDDCCRDCLRTLDNAGLCYYERPAKPVNDVYNEYYPEDDDTEDVIDVNSQDTGPCVGAGKAAVNMMH